MRNLGTILALLVFVLSCKNDNHLSFGTAISTKGSVSKHSMSETYSKLQPKDTVSSKFTATVVDVCKAKGCWMKLQLEDGKEAMVKFKDYGFFVPTDITGKEVVVNGLAFVEEMSVDDQRHFATDAGKSPEEIALINTPVKTYGFEADGVLILN